MQCKPDLLVCVMFSPCRLQLEVLLHAISLAFCCIQVSLPCLQQQLQQQMPVSCLHAATGTTTQQHQPYGRDDLHNPGPALDCDDFDSHTLASSGVFRDAFCPKVDELRCARHKYDLRSVSAAGAARHAGGHTVHAGSQVHLKQQLTAAGCR
jgi:hypothetical protein